jgi:DNA-binding Lrp family transcriptional regulator
LLLKWGARWWTGQKEPTVSLDDVRSAGAQAADREAEDAAIARVVTRLSGEYVLRALQLVIGAFGDIRAALLVQAINLANIGAVYRTEEGRSSAGPDGSLPDELRRPIRIARLADSTGLPFESARRIVRRLIDSGACKHVSGGVIVPRSTVRRPEIVSNAIANVGYLRKFVRGVHSAGLVEPTISSPGPPLDDDVAAARVVMGISAEYILRGMKLLAETYGDIRAGVVAQTIVTANTAHLDARTGEGWRYAGIDESPPDEVRRPISIARLAESLGLPYETARQQVGRMIDAGVCRRVDGGLIVPQAVLEQPGAARATLANVAHVRKFLRDLQAEGFDSENVSAAEPATALPR